MVVFRDNFASGEFEQIIDRLFECPSRAEPGELVQSLGGRVALGDLFEVGTVGFIEGHELDARGAAGALDDQLREIEDAYFAFVADVDRLPSGGGGAGEQIQGRHRVARVAERARLRAVTEDGERFAGEGLFDETWQDESVVAGLARAPPR